MKTINFFLKIISAAAFILLINPADSIAQRQNNPVQKKKEKTPDSMSNSICNCDALVAAKTSELEMKANKSCSSIKETVKCEVGKTGQPIYVTVIANPATEGCATTVKIVDKKGVASAPKSRGGSDAIARDADKSGSDITTGDDSKGGSDTNTRDTRTSGSDANTSDPSKSGSGSTADDSTQKGTVDSAPKSRGGSDADMRDARSFNVEVMQRQCPNGGTQLSAEVIGENDANERYSFDWSANNRTLDSDARTECTTEKEITLTVTDNATRQAVAKTITLDSKKR